MVSMYLNKLKKVRTMYYMENKSAREIAQAMNVSLDSVYYIMRKNNLKRRSYSEEQELRFKNKIPSFKKRKVTPRSKELMAIGAMLYWGEGYKGNDNSSYCSVDFTNSDVDMIKVFLNFLRTVYAIDEKRLRVLLYCHSNQNVSGLVQFWSINTNIPVEQFSKPYIRTGAGKMSRVMPYGVVHIRYSDKKLLMELKNLIESFKQKYAPVA